MEFTNNQWAIYMLKLIKTLLFTFIAMPCSLYALDKNGNFESRDEQDKYIAAVLLSRSPATLPIRPKELPQRRIRAVMMLHPLWEHDKVPPCE